MLYIIFGEDDFSIREALNGIKGALGPAEVLEPNTSVLNGHQITLNELTAICDTVPFLSEKRLVIVEGLLQRVARGNGKSSRKRRGSAAPSSEQVGQWSGLKEYVERMPPTAVLALVDGPIRKSNPLLKQLTSLAQVYEFPLLRTAEIQQWIRTRVEGRGGQISPQAVRLLSQLIGGNLWTVSGELEKLSQYALGRRIEEEDVRQLVSEAKESKVFDLVDAVMERRLSAATRVLNRLLEGGMGAGYLIALIGSQFRLLIQAKELSERGLSMREIGGKLEIKSEYALEKLGGRLTQYSAERLECVYRRLLEADLSIKTGRWKEELALEILVVELCSGAA